MKRLIVACGFVSMVACCGDADPKATGTKSGRAFARRLEGGPDIDNFAKISATLYRGAQPTEAGFRKLKETGVRTVINLRTLHGEEEQVKKAGMEPVEIPLIAGLVGSEPPTEEQVKRFFEVLLDPAKQPVYFHCAQGRDRTGTMAALYRIEVEGWTADEAIEEMQAFGYHDNFKDLIEYVRKYKPRGFKAPSK